MDLVLLVLVVFAFPLVIVLAGLPVALLIRGVVELMRMGLQ